MYRNAQAIAPSIAKIRKPVRDIVNEDIRSEARCLCDTTACRRSRGYRRLGGNIAPTREVAGRGEERTCDQWNRAPRLSVMDETPNLAVQCLRPPWRYAR